jgi:hypothetical protein
MCAGFGSVTYTEKRDAMESLNLPSRKVRLRLIGTAVAVLVLVTGIWWYAGWFGGHVTECGVDANGPYAKVRVGSLWGGQGVKHEGVGVEFTYDGHGYGGGGSKIEVPTFGSTTTFVRGTWPPRVINLDYDGGPKGKVTVPARVAGGYWWHTGDGLPKFHPWVRPHFKVFVVPNDKSLLGCKVVAPTNGWQ